MTLAAAMDAAYEDRWDEAFALLRSAAAAGDAFARAQLEVLNQSDSETLLQPPPMERIHDVSSVFVCREFAPPAVCDWLIEQARPRLGAAYIHNALTGMQEVDHSRTATTTGIQCDFIAAVMQERAARRTRVPVAQHERPTIISYEVGQKFEHHYDFVNPDGPGAMMELLSWGQRTITIVTYLNTDFEGAHTDFPLLNIQFRGGKGDAILFSNVAPNGAPDKNTFHAGLPPTAGRKWVLSQWIRNQPVPSRRVAVTSLSG
jgi:prolyl 4-hydroxylase